MGDPLASFARVDRHLLPVAGEIPCAGSPSRAQYLPGQPRDTRGYGYHDEMEASFRAAFAAMQRVAMAEKAHLN
ncbi:MAG: hypothetical protein Q7S89_03090 [bacterium]|nr:hypothetical protein [bacterium]